MRIESSRFCLYTHSQDGVVFYVGVGVSSRPFVTRRRNEKWLEVVARKGYYEVKILAWFDKRTQALDLEQQLIKELKPAANLMHSGTPFRSPEFRARSREFNTGRVRSAETREKISIGKRGVPAHNKGKPAANRTPIVNLETGEIYPSVRVCGETLHITEKRIKRAIETGVDKKYRLAKFTSTS